MKRGMVLISRKRRVNFNPTCIWTSQSTCTLNIHVHLHLHLHYKYMYLASTWTMNMQMYIHMYLIYTYKMTYKIIYMYMYPTSHLHLYLHVHLHVNYITSTSCIKFTNVYKWMCILHVLVCMDFEVYICLYLTSTTHHNFTAKTILAMPLNW